MKSLVLIIEWTHSNLVRIALFHLQRLCMEQITQGEEIQKIYVVPSGKTRLEINLLWENPNNDLRLYLTQPNGVSYPIFSDSIDGYIDAEILIHLNGNIYPGNWKVTIVGSRINVSEEYELYFNSI